MKKVFTHPSFITPYEAPGFLLWKAYNHWQRSQTASLAQIGLTHVQFLLLAAICWLGKQGEQVTQVKVAQRVNVDAMMTSQVVRTLERRGFITRTINKSDKRAILLSETPQGRDILEKALVKAEAVDDAFFESLGEHKENFIKALKFLVGI